MIDLIKSSVISFAQKSTFDDDLTIIVIKITEADLPQGAKLTTAKFRADLSQLKAVREFIHRLCKKAPGDNSHLSHQLQLAINEAFCNIVKHSYKSQKECEYSNSG